MSIGDKIFYTIISVIVIFLSLGIWAMLTFTVVNYKVVLLSPTEEKVLDLYKNSGEINKLWVKEIHAVKGENSLLEATIGVRISEGEEKLGQELDRIGLEYYIIGRIR